MTTTDLLVKKPKESIDDYLWRIGSLKEAGVLAMTWYEIRDICNENNSGPAMSDSYWRKRFYRLQFDHATKGAKEESQKKPAISFKRCFKPKSDEEMLKAGDTDGDDNISSISKFFVPSVRNEYEKNKNFDMDDASSGFDIEEHKEELLGEKIKTQIRDERSALNRIIRSEARNDALLDLFRETIQKYDNHFISSEYDVKYSDNAIYAMLSDIHYGLAFNTSAGEYDSDIAHDRIMAYAKEIENIGDNNDANVCYVSLMGDLVSGNIHSAIRLENRENIVEQVVGVSEVVAEFLLELCNHFDAVHINSVYGNHSRIDLSAEDALRAEKLDALIPWYCKVKLSNIDNVFWHDNEIDSSIASFTIFDKNYIAVHGDFDANLKNSVGHIERLIHRPIDYILAGHLHVPEARIETVGFIRNGAVCGSGDEYTMKKRLFSKPSQMCMVVSEAGVKALYPVML